jgi:hypothetical protein
VPGQLVGPERLLPEFRDSRTPAGQIEIGEMAGWVGHGVSVLGKDLDPRIVTSQ